MADFGFGALARFRSDGRARRQLRQVRRTAGAGADHGFGDVIRPASPNLVMLGPALNYFAAWYVLGLIGFWVFGFEPMGRTLEEIDDQHDAPASGIATSDRAAAG